MSFKTKLLKSFLFIVLIPALVAVVILTMFTYRTVEYNNKRNVDGVYNIIDENVIEKLTSIQNLIAYAYLDDDLLETFSRTTLNTPYETSVALRDSLDRFALMASVAADSVEEITFYTDSPLAEIRQGIKTYKEYPYNSQLLGTYGYDAQKNIFYYATRLKTNDNRTMMLITIDPEKFFPAEFLDNGDNLYQIDFKNKVVQSNAKSAQSFEFSRKIGKDLFDLKIHLRHNSLMMQFLLVGLLIAVLLMIIFGAVYTQYHKILKVIGTLQEKVNSVVNGEENVNFKSDYEDELGLLSNDINAMVIHLQNANHDLYEMGLEKEKLNYQVLVKQFDSHFLYNTLSLLNWHSYDNQDAEMSALIQDLSLFYRTSLNKGKTSLTLEKEFENVETYLRIRHVLNPELFSFETYLAPELKNFTVINFILQPLVENAIEHGFADEKPENKVTVSAEKLGDKVVIIVADNGQGMDEATLRGVIDAKVGYGFSNTKKRINYYFGAQATCDIYSEVGEGTVITVTLPFVQLDLKEG